MEFLCPLESSGIPLSIFYGEVFIWENVTLIMLMDSLEIIASCDLEFVNYNKLNE